jgi:hypothetical protein
MNNCRVEILGHQIEFEYQKIEVEPNRISPTLIFVFKGGVPRLELGKTITIFNLGAEISINTNSKEMIVGYANSINLHELSSNYDYLYLYLQIDNYILSQIEKIRNGNDLSLNFNIKCMEFNFVSNNKGQGNGSIKGIRIPKSDWIDKILNKLNYKMVSLIELPKLNFVGLNNVFEKIDSAFNNYSSGDVSNVLTNCRYVLETLDNYIRKDMKLEKIKTLDNGRKIPIPDWKKFFNDDTKGMVVEKIFREVYTFNSVGGPHPSREHILPIDNAYFAILQVYSIAFIVISRLKEINETKEK